MKNIQDSQDGYKKYKALLKKGHKTPIDPITKAKQNPKSLRFAINAKCYDCSCYQRNEVKHCTATDCSLHGVRPWQPPKT